MTALTPCPGCPALRLDCACVTDISQMSLADVKAVFADECLDHATCTHVGDHPLSIVPRFHRMGTMGHRRPHRQGYVVIRPVVSDVAWALSRVGFALAAGIDRVLARLPRRWGG